MVARPAAGKLPITFSMIGLLLALVSGLSPCGVARASVASLRLMRLCGLASCQVIARAVISGASGEGGGGEGGGGPSSVKLSVAEDP